MTISLCKFAQQKTDFLVPEAELKHFFFLTRRTGVLHRDTDFQKKKQIGFLETHRGNGGKVLRISRGVKGFGFFSF